MRVEEVSLTPQEVADILKITKNTVYELIKRGELPAYRVGRKIRIDLKDVEAYKKHGKTFEIDPEPAVYISQTLPPIKAQDYSTEEDQGCKYRFVICGQDMILDILTRHLDRHKNGIRAFRHFVGSFAGLWDLYHDNAQMTAVHLWDGDTDTYNIPYVRRFLPGIPAIVIHLAIRTQGFYVASGNPKGVKEWGDLTRPDIKFLNREKGSGTRVLLDEQLRKLGVDRREIKGYEREEMSHLSVASAIAMGEADIGMGNEKASLQVRGIDFLPLKRERYELVFKKDDIDKLYIRAAIDILQSEEFKREIEGLGDYDLSETGRIIAET